MKNIFKFLFVFLGLCHAASAITLPNPILPELPASKTVNFTHDNVVVKCSKISTTDDCGIHNSATAISHRALAHVVKFLTWNERNKLIQTNKKNAGKCFSSNECR